MPILRWQNMTMREPWDTIFGGLNIMVDHKWPRDYVADEVYTYLPHPFWCWLWRVVFRREFSPSMERGGPIFRDRDAIMAGCNLFCSPRQFEALQRNVEFLEMRKARLC